MELRQDSVSIVEVTVINVRVKAFVLNVLMGIMLLIMPAVNVMKSAQLVLVKEKIIVQTAQIITFGIGAQINARNAILDAQYVLTTYARVA